VAAFVVSVSGVSNEKYRYPDPWVGVESRSSRLIAASWREIAGIPASGIPITRAINNSSSSDRNLMSN